MTCIVGFAEDGKVTIGGDSAGVGGLAISIREDVKVFKKKKMIFGFTTSFRMGQLIRYKLEIPEHPDKMSDMEYLCTLFMDSVRECFEENGFLKKEEERQAGGTFLVGYNGAIYCVYDDFQVQQTVDGWDACGCGEEFAKGALHALRGTKMTPKKRLTAALDAASYLSMGVSAPYNFVSIGG